MGYGDILHPLDVGHVVDVVIEIDDFGGHNKFLMKNIFHIFLKVFCGFVKCVGFLPYFIWGGQRAEKNLAQVQKWSFVLWKATDLGLNVVRNG